MKSIQFKDMESLEKEIQINSVDGIEYFITVSFQKQTENQEDLVNRAYQVVYEYMNQNHIEIFHERVFGSVSCFDKHNKIRKDSVRKFFNEEVPFSYIGAPPIWGEGIAGVIIHGIHLKNSGGRLTNVAYEGQICGRLYESSTDRRLMLNAIYCDEYEKKSSEQVYATFQKIDRILRTFGFQYKEVLRTWIYIPEILDYYAAFNKARNQFFEEWNILPRLDEINDFERIFMPASTGVGCENPYSNVAFFDVYAISKSVRGSELKIYNETGSEQRSAYRYGSAFSRSIIVSAQQAQYLFLSGTASIDAQGETIHVGNIYNQIHETFNVISTLIQDANMDMQCWMEGVVFFKNPAYVQEYLDAIKQNERAALPVILCVADICRDDLLFEIDGVFAKKGE